MKKLQNLIKVAIVSFMILSASACSTGESAAIKNGKKFLASFYTTNENERYTAFSSADSEDQIEAIETYYKEFEDQVDSELLETMKQNRIPVKYDKLYLDAPVTVDDVSLSKMDEKYSFVVTGRQNNEVVSFAGEIGFSDDKKVNYFYEK